MKKNTYKILASAFALGLFVASPATTVTTHAQGFTGADSNEYYDGDDGVSVWENSSSDSGSSSSSDSSSSHESSSNSGSHDSGSSNSGAGYDGGSSGDGGSGNGTVSAPTGLARKGNTVTIPGSETFRQINKAAEGRVAIYHCGIEQYTAQLKDADGSAAAYKSCGVYLDEASGKWYLNIVTEQDAAGYTVGTYKGSVTYLTKLGMSGVMINNALAVDAAAAE